ncbi:MAG: DUF853 family protein [Planctomycetes bacterium]|nr:DUF853 family protein [Planctomycetota bacterium]
MSVLLGNSPEGPVELPASTFLRHMVCLGSSGSGKTVAAKAICEEFVRMGVPILAIDPQGDIASLALPATPEAVSAKGSSPEALAEYRARAEVVIWTPASSIGVPLAVNPLEQLDMEGAGGEARIRALHAIAQNLTSLLGYDLGSDDGRAASGYLDLVLEHLSSRGPRIRTFDRLAAFLADLPEPLAGRTAELLEERKARDLRRKIQLLSIGAQKLLFQLGVPLRIPTLLGLGDEGTPGRTRVSVVYLNTLHSQAEKEFLLAQVAQALYDWMLKSPSTEPQALFYIDEVSPYLPPVAKPACKDALALLFKQARKYGVCCLLASQNPGDVDYKCLAQFSTWNLGRMMLNQDVKKVQRAIQSIAGDETERIVERLPGLAPGEFVLLSPDTFPGPVELRVRWLLTEHRTLDEDAVREAMAGPLRERLLAKVPQAPPEEEDAPLAPPAGQDAGEAAAVAEGLQESADENGEPERPEEEEDTSEGPGEDRGDEAAARPGTRGGESARERIEGHLVRERRALTAAELHEALGISEPAVRRALQELESEKRVDRGKSGRSFHYWSSAYRFYPDRGLVLPVLVARLRATEREALAAASAATSQLFGLVKKDLGRATYRHLPLWRVGLTVTEERGFLLWKERRTRGEFLYFHARTADLLLATDAGIRFVSVVDRDPADIRDLDGLCEFDEKTPGEVDLDRRALQKILSEKEIVERVQRKFPIRVEGCRLAFLPFWEFPVASESRAVAIDAVTGKPFEPS